LRACREDAAFAWAISLFTPGETIVRPCLRRIEDWHEFVGLYAWLYSTKTIFLLYDREHGRPVLFSVARDYVRNIETRALRNPGIGLSAKIRHLYEVVPFGRLIRKRFPGGKQPEMECRYFRTLEDFFKEVSFASADIEDVLRVLNGDAPLDMSYALVAPSSFKYMMYAQAPGIVIPLAFEASLPKEYVAEGLIPLEVEGRSLNVEVPCSAWIEKVKKGGVTLLTLYYPLQQSMLLVAVGSSGLMHGDQFISMSGDGWPLIKEVRRESLALSSIEVNDLEEAMRLAESIKKFFRKRAKGRKSSDRRKEAKRRAVEVIYMANHPTATRDELREFRRRVSEHASKCGGRKTTLKTAIEILLDEQGYIRLPKKQALLAYSPEGL